MQVDAFTVLLVGLLIRTVLAVIFLVFWIKDTRAVWFGWWSATFVLANLSAGFFIVSGFAPEFFSVGTGTGALVAAMGCCWQGARTFEGRAPLWLPLLGAPALWLVLCLFPFFLDNTPLRVIVSSLLLTPLIAMTAVELWRGRNEPLPSRWPVILLFASLAAVFAARIPLVGLLPFPFGAQLIEMNWVAVFALLLILHSVALAVLFVALTRERLERVQKERAQTDLLTGALNRRAFMHYGERHLARHRRAETPLCLLMLDIDRFKPLNDRLGHAGGDKVLMEFVKVVRANIRPNDLLFRLGGDEFCCLLPETGTLQARQAAERLRGCLEGTSADGVTPMTASMGIASTETFGYELELLMHEADLAVYAAKREGRNRVSVAVRLREATPGPTPATA